MEGHRTLEVLATQHEEVTVRHGRDRQRKRAAVEERDEPEEVSVGEIEHGDRAPAGKIAKGFQPALCNQEEASGNFPLDEHQYTFFNLAADEKRRNVLEDFGSRESEGAFRQWTEKEIRHSTLIVSLIVALPNPS